MHDLLQNPLDASPLEVNSCFGGLAIYKYDSMVNDCTYTFRSTVPPYLVDCEHVFFHECLRKRNKDIKIVANPMMKLWYGHRSVDKLHWSDAYEHLVTNGWSQTILNS